MWLKILVWLGTKKGKWVLRIFALLIAGVVQYAYTAHAEKRAYNNGYLVAKAEANERFFGNIRGWVQYRKYLENLHAIG